MVLKDGDFANLNSWGELKDSQPLHNIDTYKSHLKEAKNGAIDGLNEGRLCTKHWKRALPDSVRNDGGVLADAALYGGFDLEQGTEGFMTGFAFPEVLMAIDRAAREGNVERAHAIYAQFLPLLVFEQQPGVGIRKEVYRLRGLIECGRVRRPAPQVSTVAAAALAAQIERSLYDPFPGVDLTKPLTPLFERLSRS